MKHGWLLCLAVCGNVVFVLGAEPGPKLTDPRLKVELFAEHPAIVTPTGIDVDAKGRVWALESNTHFPPKEYQGHPTDRLLVFTPAETSGQPPHSHLFTDELKHAMSVLVIPDWLRSRTGVSPSPYLHLQALVATRREVLLFTDSNNDLKADSRQQLVLLETDGDYPHNALAGFATHPNGWVYFGCGENLGAKYTIKGKDGRSYSGGGEGGNVYRMRPDGTELTHVATGFWNPHASCVDAFGRVFSTDNDPDSRPPCRLMQIIEGGDYGYRFRNGRKGLHPFTAWNGEIPGTLPMIAGTGEAPSGIVAYEHSAFPEDYRGNLLVGSWGDHRIDRFKLIPKGASYTAQVEPLITGDADFRPVGLAMAPDGSLYFTDWVKRDYQLHRHGRIWRISPQAVPAPVEKPLGPGATPSWEELVSRMNSPVMIIRRNAAQFLVGRLAFTSEAFPDNHLANAKLSERARAELHWAAGIPGLIPNSAPIARVLKQFPLTHRDLLGEMAKAPLTVEALGKVPPETWQDPFWMGTLVPRLAQTMRDEANRGAYLDWWRSSKTLPQVQPRMAILLALRLYDPKNTQLLEGALKDSHPMLRRLGMQWAAEERFVQYKDLIAAEWHRPETSTDMFRSSLAAVQMLEGIDPKEMDATPPGKFVLPMVINDKQSPQVRTLALKLVSPGDPGLTVEVLRKLIEQPDAGLRMEAVRSLALGGRPEALSLLVGLAKDSNISAVVRADAVLGLASQTGETAQTALITALKDPAMEREALRSLRGLLAGNENLKKEFQVWTEMKSEVLAKHPDPDLIDLWQLAALGTDLKLPAEIAATGTPRPAAGLGWLTATAEAGDVEAGRRIFFHTRGPGCSKCHTVDGRGGKVGPDLTTIARTASREKLATSIVAPSQEIAPQFVAWNIVLTSGQVLTGMIVSEESEKLVIGLADGQTRALTANEIEQRIPVSASLMPEKLTELLTPGEFRDLVSYLETLR